MLLFEICMQEKYVVFIMANLTAHTVRGFPVNDFLNLSQKVHFVIFDVHLSLLQQILNHFTAVGRLEGSVSSLPLSNFSC